MVDEEKCYHVMTVCPRCGHSWHKHDARHYPKGCCGSTNKYLKQCGCMMTFEQAERQHFKECGVPLKGC